MNYLKTFIPVFLLVCIAPHLSAQDLWNVSPEQYKMAQQSVVVLKNEAVKIPLSNDDAIKAEHYHWGDFGSTMGAEIERSFPVPTIRLKNRSPKDSKLAKAPKILSIDLSETIEDEGWEKRLKEWLKAEETITVVFGDSLNISGNLLPFEQSKHLIYVSGKSSLVQSIAAQVLFGGLGSEGRLSKNWTINFQKGAGFDTEGGIRLSYGPAALKGMDRQLLKDSIGAIAQMAVDSGAFPGCQVLVVKEGQVVFHEAWGHHTYEKTRAVKRSDIYDFASVTKVTSALPALMKLHGEGKFELEATLGQYFPKFKNSNKADLKMRPILAHHARLKPWIPYWRSTIKKNGKFKWRTFKRKPSRRFPIHITDNLYLHRKYKKRIYKAIKKSPLNEDVGYVYSGLVFYLWPKIVADLTGASYEDYLQKTFYEPLGASTIGYNPAARFPLERIPPTENDTFFRKVQIHGKVHDEGAVMMGGVSANAGLFGSANDLAKLMQMYLKEGTYGGERFIEAASVKEFTRCQYCEEGNRRGLGFDKPLIEYDPAKSSVAKDAGPSSFGHSGYTGTFTWVDPKHELIYIFFSNRVYPTRENRKIYQLNVRPNIHQVIYDSFLSKQTEELK